MLQFILRSLRPAKGLTRGIITRYLLHMNIWITRTHKPASLLNFEDYNTCKVTCILLSKIVEN